MYSPKIKTDLIPILYRMAEENKKPMTRIVDELLRPVLIEHEAKRAIPYCMSCYSKLDIDKAHPQATAFCRQCKSETMVIYTLPIESQVI
jgi:hypothetical protein